MIRKGIHPSAVVDFLGRIEIPDTTVIEPLAVLYGGPAAVLKLGERNIFYPGCVIRIEEGVMTTGCDVSFGPGCQIYEPRGGLEIGNHCMIAGGTMICGTQHGSERLDVPMRQQGTSAHPIVIEDDVWLGMGVKVLPGVRIGKGSIIGAGSVVAENVPPYSVAMGVPCRVVRSR